jgi:hypothetical protein
MWLRKSPSTTACCVHRINCWDLPFHPDLLRCTHVEITPRRITRHSCAVLFCGLSQYMHRTGISDDGSHFQLDSLRGLQLNDYGQVTLLRTGCYSQVQSVLRLRRPALPEAFLHMLTLLWFLAAVQRITPTVVWAAIYKLRMLFTTMTAENNVLPKL